MEDAEFALPVQGHMPLLLVPGADQAPVQIEVERIGVTPPNAITETITGRGHPARSDAQEVGARVCESWR